MEWDADDDDDDDDSVPTACDATRGDGRVGADRYRDGPSPILYRPTAMLPTLGIEAKG